jgi:hypothetical protein
MTLYTFNPTEDRSRWYVWDMDAPLPPKPIFFGSMEECGLVADVKNGVRPTPIPVLRVKE